MLLFSTMLDIKDTLSETDFIHLLIEANQDHDNFKDNIIPIDKIKWDGNCLKNSFGDDDLSLKTCKYRDGNIMAARFEKNEPDGKSWTTDYVWNIDDKKMCITLDRVFREGSPITNEEFSSPSFIKHLIANNFLEADNGLPILDVPVMIDKSNIALLIDILNGLKEYNLPIIYVSKRYDNNADPLDTHILAKKLRGVAHVFVETDQDINPEIRKNSEQRQTFDGRVSILFTDKSFPPQTLNFYHEFDNNESGFISAIINDVLHYMNSRKIPSGYTWDEVNYNISERKLDKRTKDYDEAVNDYIKSDDENKSLINDQIMLQEENNALRADNYRLEAKNDTFTFAHDTYTDAAITLSLNKEGTEDEKGKKFEEFFPGEAKEILLETLKAVLNQFEDRPRRYDVLKAIIDNNDCPDILNQMGKELDNLMISYKDTGMDAHTKSVLDDLGFNEIRHTDHYIFYYHNIERYNATFASTPGSNNSGFETAKEIKKKCF